MKIKRVEWSEELHPNEDSNYNHVTGTTPIGQYHITWKGRKEDPSFDIEFEDNGWIDSDSTLERAKATVQHIFESIIKKCLEDTP
ncbi:hypothetical protein A9Q81_11735 [Gammaproteobacteria bacterium 42_54_T18]|nr:hypothetical protein A9Q81_11735 [Gammaproteobacteria bacterium 42_54_T18]